MQADVPHQRTRVDTFDADDTRRFEVITQRLFRTPIRRARQVFFDDEALDVDARGFGVLAIDADVADLRIGHAHDLPLVGRIGENFLVAGHRRVEDDLADRLANRAESVTAKSAPIGKRQYSFMLRHQTRCARSASYLASYTISPPTIVKTVLPCSRIPANGLLRLFERNFAGSTFHSLFGSMTVISAAAPGESEPASIRIKRAGLADINSTSRRAEINFL